MNRLSKYVAYLLIIAGSAISCSKSSNPAPSLAGTWNVTTYSVTGCTDGSLNLTDTPCGTMTVSVFVSCETWVFTATTISVTGSVIGVPIVFDYTLSGNTITLKLAGTAVSSGTYAMTSTALAITNDYGSVGMGCKMIEHFTKQ